MPGAELGIELGIGSDQDPLVGTIHVGDSDLVPMGCPVDVGDPGAVG
jgi:hypothetical protein